MCHVRLYVDYDLHSLQGKKDLYNGKIRCNNYKVVAIKCYYNDKKIIASRCNKLRDNRFMQH